MRDTRRAPFCWQSVAALALVRTRAQRVAQTLAVYVAMTEISNEQRSESFTASKARIAAYSGCSKRMVDDCVEWLTAVGLIQVEHRKGPQGGDLGNVYVLAEGVPTVQGGEGAEPAPLFKNGTPSGSSNRSDYLIKKNGSREMIEALHAHFVAVIEPANRALTPSRERLYSKALAEAPLGVCSQAIDGLRAWHAIRGGELSLSRVFQTRPGGSPLGEQIEWFASRAPGATPSSGFVPSEQAATIATAKEAVLRGAAYPGNPLATQQAQEAIDTLSEFGIVPSYYEVEVAPGVTTKRVRFNDSSTENEA